MVNNVINSPLKNPVQPPNAKDCCPLLKSRMKIAVFEEVRVDAGLIQKSIQYTPPEKGIEIKSLLPSTRIEPPSSLLNVGPFVNVPSFPLPLKSFQVVPLPGYDFTLAPSRHSARPSVTIRGECANARSF